MKNVTSRTLRGFAGIAAACLLAAPSTAFGQGLEMAFNGLRLNSVLIAPLPAPVGADLSFRLPLGNRLSATIRLAGGYQDRKILRNDTTGNPLAAPATFESLHWFHYPVAEADLGMLYRLGEDTAYGEFFGALRGRWESNITTLGTAVFPDAKGLAALSGIAGAGFDSVSRDMRRMYTGAAGEASVEWAPPGADFSGGTDFLRVSARLEGYQPLFALGEGDLHSLSVYAAGFAAADAAWGARIPLYVLTSFGGRYLRDGLGSSVRGFQSWGYEARAKAVATGELRAAGPALFGIAGLRPVGTLFADAGWYSGLDRATGTASTGAPWSSAQGFVASTGAGLALGLFDLAYVGARAGLRFALSDPLYSVYFSDAGQGTFFWNITFLMHF